MKIIINNKVDKYQKAVVLGSRHHAIINYQNGKIEPSFFDFSTDEGVDISVNEKTSKEDVSKILNGVFSNCLMVKNIEFTSNYKEQKQFIVSTTDANGSIFCHQNFFWLHHEQKDFFPIVKNCEDIQGLNGFDFGTSLLFILKPLEKIELVINEVIK